ncbi:3-ketoacyl-ACP reductase [Pareuzebyella sediminis]|uniref:3-ketoacyl-ACP reductase n=1 Tax=Pareuzebyella sediminis TaxID=2607998 RepID=UPI0011F0576D|nr:3-ketoacyl-ACP reductase [Pareuzebyella sediminis]
MKRNILITGGSRGIGLGIAKELAKAGNNLAINGIRDENQVSDVLEELKSFGNRVIYCQGNIALDQEREKIWNELMKKFKKLHVLVNNAGVAPEHRVDLLDMTEESYDRVMNINLKGPFFLTQKVAVHMLENKKEDSGFEGCIVNISSISATTASVNRGEYCISKSGMSMMTKLFAVKLGTFDIPVYEVQPGIIETDMTAAVLEKYKRLIEEGLTVQPRLGTPDDVGKVVSALVEQRLPYTTGQVVRVDGGLSIPRL